MRRLSSRLSRLAVEPERTRIPAYAALEKAACAPFRKEGRITFVNATKFHRKSGGAQWRDEGLTTARRLGSIDQSGSCSYYRRVSLAALPPRSMVGQLPLEQHIGVRIPGGQPFIISNLRYLPPSKKPQS